MTGSNHHQVKHPVLALSLLALFLLTLSLLDLLPSHLAVYLLSSPLSFFCSYAVSSLENVERAYIQLSIYVALLPFICKDPSDTPTKSFDA